MNAARYREQFPETFKARQAARLARKGYREAVTHHTYILGAYTRYLAIFAGQHGDPLAEHVQNEFGWREQNLGNTTADVLRRYREARIDALRVLRTRRVELKTTARAEAAPWPRDLGTRYEEFRGRRSIRVPRPESAAAS